MNATNAPAPAPAPRPAPDTAQRDDNDEPRAGAFEQQQAGATFERLLRAKSAARERQDDDETEATPDGSAAAPAWPLAAPPRATSTPNVAATPAGAAALDQPSVTLRAAALEASFSAPMSPLATGEASHSWEVSLGEPLGVPMEVRAARTVNPAAGNVAAWSLTVSSSARDAAVLARHVPRLNERLRAREVSTHVRVERDDEVAE